MRSDIYAPQFLMFSVQNEAEVQILPASKSKRPPHVHCDQTAGSCSVALRPLKEKTQRFSHMNPCKLLTCEK